MVLERYNKLEPLLQETLKKASILGEEFESALLESILSINNATALLMEIEEISALINQKLNLSDIFSFSTYESYVVIKQMTSAFNRIKWNALLGRYYLKCLTNNGISLMEECDYIKRAAIYFEEADQKINSLSLYIQLIPKLISLGLYRQTQLTILKVKDIDNELKILPRNINLNLLLWQYYSYKNVFDFENAYHKLIEIENFSEHTAINNLQLSYENAYLLYELGYTYRSYEIAIKLLREMDTKKIDNKKFIHISFQTLELISALEETLGDVKFIEHFNQALCFAKKNNLVYEYYKLLRKSNMVHSEPTASILLNEAKNYFKNKNQLEYAMTLHNMATMHIFEVSENIICQDELEEAYNIFIKLGFKGIIYTKNSKVILQAKTKFEYKNGLDVLVPMADIEEDNFVKLVLLNNIAVFQRKLNMLDECKHTIKLIENINVKENYPYFRSYLFLQKGYYYKAIMDYEKSYEQFLNYYNSKYNDYNSIFISALKNIIFISKKINNTPPYDIFRYLDAINEKENIFYTNDLFFCDLQFWE